MRRVLLTGASGFVGRAILPLLWAAGHEVHTIGRTRIAGAVHHEADLLKPGVKPIVRDIGATHLLHAAWYAVPGRYWDAPENLDWVAASLAIARGFAAGGGQRLVGIGSCAEYEWGGDPLDEDDAPIATGILYGTAKASLGSLLVAGAPALGLSVAWGRLFFPYGPEERPERLLGTLLAAVASGSRASFGAGLQSRDFIHVDDAAAALVALLDSDMTGVVNIGSGEAIEIRRFVAIAAEAAGMANRIDLGATAAGTGEAPIVRAGMRRLAGELGWQPRFTVESGLVDAVRRFQRKASSLVNSTTARRPI